MTNKSKMAYGLSVVVKAVGLLLSIAAPLYGILAYFLLGAEHPVNVALAFFGISDQLFLGRSLFDLWLAILLYLMIGLAAAAFFGFLYRMILAGGYRSMKLARAQAESEKERISATGMQAQPEAKIAIEGVALTDAQSMVVRMALDAFMDRMQNVGLGDDRQGRSMSEACALRANEVLAMIHNDRIADERRAELVR